MKHLYMVESYDKMMNRPIITKYESEVELTRGDIIKKWGLNCPDIERFRIFEVIDGEKNEMK